MLAIIGDFNVDLLSNHVPLNWLQIQNIFNLSQMVMSPTRVTTKSATLIDHVYSNRPNQVKYTSVKDYSISDHFPVCITYCRYGHRHKKQHHEYITYRSMKKFDQNLFFDDLQNCPLDNVHCSNDPDESLLLFINYFSEVLHKHAPLITKRVKNVTQNDWMNDDILNAMRNRDYYHKIKEDFGGIKPSIK